MRIGYACQTLGVPAADYRGCLAKNATPSALTTLIEHNLGSLANAIAYNIRENIRLFRITSDLIPFGSSPVNELPWWSLFAPQLASIGAQIRRSNLRVSLHPGQYTVLNSPRPEVVCRAVADLDYHARILDALALGPEHKIILHVGGVYGDKTAAISRFVDVFLSLDENVRRRLVIENDDRCYTIADVLGLGRQLAAPVVFDNLHHRLNPPGAPLPKLTPRLPKLTTPSGSAHAARPGNLRMARRKSIMRNKIPPVAPDRIQAPSRCGHFWISVRSCPAATWILCLK